MYLIYDLREKEQCVAVFNNRTEVANFLNIHKDSVSRSIQRKQPIKKRFEIIKIKAE